MNLIVLGKKKNMKLLCIAVSIVAFSFLLAGCGTKKDTSLGILDVNKVMENSQKVKQFQEQLNVKGKELSEELEKGKENISQEEFQKRQEEAYGQFLKTKQDLEGQIDQAIKTAVEEVGKEKNIDVILYKNGVAHGGTDITDDVLKKMQ